MSIADLIRSMAAAGAPPEAIAIAVEALEAGAARDADRRAKQAERKRKSRLSKDNSVTVTGQSRGMDRTVTAVSCDPPSPNDGGDNSDSPEINLNPVPPIVPPAPPKAKAMDDGWPKDAFSVWYAVYPRKKSPDAAERAFTKVRRSKRVTWEVLLAATRRFAAQPHDPKFTPHPATWLNSGSWNDEPDSEAVASTRRPDAGRSAADQVISATRRRLAQIDPGGWSPPDRGFDFDQDASANGGSGRPVIIDHDGQETSRGDDDGGFSTLFLRTPDRLFGGH